MPDDTVYFIDANVPMYAAGADHPLKGPCLAILDQIARGQSGRLLTPMSSRRYCIATLLWDNDSAPLKSLVFS